MLPASLHLSFSCIIWYILLPVSGHLFLTLRHHSDPYEVDQQDRDEAAATESLMGKLLCHTATLPLKACCCYWLLQHHQMHPCI